MQVHGHRSTKVQSYMSAGSLTRAILPDALQMGITACGGVEQYYQACVAEEKRARQAALQAMQGGSPIAAAMRVNALFPDNSHEVIEQAVTEVQKKGLTIIDDMISAGLTTPLPDWWAIPSLRRGRIGEGGNAHRTMVPDSRGERFVLQREGTSWPIYCTWANFSFDARTLAVGQRVGAPLDVTHTTEATYRVNESIEDQAIHGLTDDQGSVMTIDGMSAPGLLSSSNTFDYATWTGLTGAQIEDIVADAIQSLRITHPGPFTLYYPGNYDKKLNSRYSTVYDAGSIRMVLEQLGPYGGRNLQVRLADTLPDNRVVLVQMDKRAVDVVVGQQPVPISWKDGPGWNTFWVVLSCVIFRMFVNANGEYGVAVGDLT